jgi:DNA-binding CsgD family transcriptional regulator
VTRSVAEIVAGLPAEQQEAIRRVRENRGQILNPREHVFIDEPSTRELQVLALVAEGATNKEAGVALGVSRETVKTHLKHSTQKLGARDRTHAVTICFRRGLLE